MSIKLCPIYEFSNTQHKCFIYLNRYKFSEHGLGKTVFDARNNVVEKLLNKYLNFTKICASVNKSVKLIIVLSFVTVYFRKSMMLLLTMLRQLWKR